MINKAILVGRIGRDPEVKTVGNAKVANFSVATTERYTDKSGQKKETTEWHNVVIWRGLAEVAEKYLSKGQLVYIEGKIKTRSWDDKDGNKRYATEIVADTMQMLGGGERKEQEPAPEETGYTSGSNDNNDDQLPF